jgi:hypothetical protein
MTAFDRVRDSHRGLSMGEDAGGYRLMQKAGSWFRQNGHLVRD